MSVPSFTSFPDLEPGPSRPSHTDSDSKSKSRSRDKEHEKRRHKKKERERSQRKSKGDQGGYTTGIEEHETELYPEGYLRPDGNIVYYKDTKGDRYNITYGGPHGSDIPKYTLINRGKNILGLPSTFTVVHRGHHDIAIAIGGRRKVPSLTDSGSLRLLSTMRTRRLLSSSKLKRQKDPTEGEGFIRIKSQKTQGSEPSYRSITGQDENSSEFSSVSRDELSGSSDEDSDTTPETSLQATLKILEEKLSLHPDDISSWLSLFFHTLSTIPYDSKNAPKARAEIGITVLTRALSAHPDNAKSRRLQLKYLQAGEELWDQDSLFDEWEDTLENGDINLWIEWLDWRIRRAENGVDSIGNSAKRVLIATAFRDSGFVERAMALFQVQAELTYKMHASVTNESFEAQLDELEEFWESEVPRCGESMAKGWAHWVSENRPETLSTPLPKPQYGEFHMDPFMQWAYEETFADKHHTLSSRSSDNDEDPYATVLFSDIRPYLINLSTNDSRHFLRLIWLSFLGLHIPGLYEALSSTASNTADDRWTYDQPRTEAFITAIFPSQHQKPPAESCTGVVIGQERHYASVFGPIKNWGYGSRNPLECVAPRQCLLWSAVDTSIINVQFVREVFRQCRTEDDEEWDALMLAFELVVDAKNALKVSKSLLAIARDSLSHWAAHCQLERFRGRIDEARRVYQTVLGGLSHEMWDRQGQLWFDWAEMEWLSGRIDQALQVVLQSVRSKGSMGIAVLRAKRALEETISKIPSSDWRMRQYWIKLGALLELLTTTPGNSLSWLDTELERHALYSIAHESLTVASCTLLYNHAITLRNVVPPSLLRQRTEQALAQYPNNTVVLGIFLESQKGQAIWGRTKALLSEHVGGDLPDKDVARRVFDIWLAGWEQGRWDAEEERVRSGLSNALAMERTRGSVSLWRLYIEFEIRCGQLQRAKKLLYRAISECPLVKELYLLAFGPLRDQFKGRELKDFAEAMAERGLRMRAELEAALEGWVDPDAEVQVIGDDHHGEADIERSADELRRLRPY
ncbi:NRDE2 family protein [Abortiporus biennis]